MCVCVWYCWLYISISYCIDITNRRINIYVAVFLFSISLLCRYINIYKMSFFFFSLIFDVERIWILIVSLLLLLLLLLPLFFIYIYILSFRLLLSVHILNHFWCLVVGLQLCHRLVFDKKKKTTRQRKRKSRVQQQDGIAFVSAFVCRSFIAFCTNWLWM